MKNKIKSVVFDVGGVLELAKGENYMSRSVHGYVAKKLNVNLDTYFDVIGGVHEKSVTGKVSRKRMLEIMTKDFGVKKEKLLKLYERGFKRIFRTNKKLYDFAYGLKKKGYKIGILSDQWYLSKDNLIDNKKIKKFDFVVVSCDVGLRKPDEKIYKLTLRKARTKAEEMVFIDNREWNVGVARELGIKGVLFKDNKQCFKDLEKLGVEG